MCGKKQKVRKREREKGRVEEKQRGGTRTFMEDFVLQNSIKLRNRKAECILFPAHSNYVFQIILAIQVRMEPLIYAQLEPKEIK